MRRLVLIFGIVAGIQSFPAFGQSCDPAYQRAIQDGDATKLSHAIDACSAISDRLNNLALWLEKKRLPAAAEKLYRRALAAPDATIIPYAGLGDALRSQGKTAEAVKAFAIFLKGLNAEVLRGDPHGVAEYRQTYLDRLKSALVADGRPNEDPNVTITDALLPAPFITRLLTTRPKRKRGINVEFRDRPFVEIPLRFKFDSSRLSLTARAQLTEVAISLNNPLLKETRILIEGHTDDIGTEAYNLGLSLRRAEIVRQTLIGQHQFAKTQFVVKGFGESRPAISNSTDAGQAINRRVTLVNLGKR